MSSVNLDISVAGVSDTSTSGMPYTMTLPSQEEREQVAFDVDLTKPYCVHFTLHQTFGTRVIGKGVLLSTQISSAMKAQVPLLNGDLTLLGELEVLVQLTRATPQIDGKK